MKSFLKSVMTTVVGVVVGLVIAFILVPMFIVLIFKGASRTPSIAVEKNSILHLNLNGQLVERHRPLDFEVLGQQSIFGEDRTIGLWEATHALESAKADKRISGVFLEIGNFDAGWAGVTALRKAIETFALSGKWVYAYAERMDEKSYYLATAAGKIWLQPSGELEFNGLAVNEPFLKGLFEKLELEPRIFRAGKFKAAVEPLILDKMSDENRRQTQELVDDIWSEVRQTVAKKRNIDPKKIDELAAALTVMSADEAKANGLITELVFQDDAEAEMRKLTVGEDAELALVTPMNYLRDRQVAKSGSGNKKIAVLFAEGEIRSGTGGRDSIGSVSFREDLEDALADEEVAAIVLRVNSPGGDALASDVIWRALMVTDEEIPVVVSMGDMAASGGYYMAAAGRYVFAEPTTITGSIGVFGVMFSTEKFFRNKTGVKFDRVVTHPHADIGDPNRPMTQLENDKIQKEVNRVYSRFLDVVEESRGYEKRSDLESIAEGRVWSGSRAKELGLVDEVGGLDRAILKAAEFAELGKAYKVEIFPKDSDGFTRLLEKFAGDVYMSTVGQTSVGDRLMERLGLSNAKELAKTLQGLTPGIHARLLSEPKVK